MSNETPPKPRRSLRVVFKAIKFVLAMVLTFCISFAVTLTLKSEHPADSFGVLAEEIFSDDAPAKPLGVPEIRTLFDEQNAQPFDPKPVAANDVPARQGKELGFFAALDRMNSVKTAVDAKIKNIPNYVPLNRMPYRLSQAVVAVEDARFYKHKGFDLIGIVRAILVNVEAGEIQEGASTITQQTVKNLFLTSDQTFSRKAEELILSMNMEKHFDKNKILEIYLNVIYFGSGFYGVYDASYGYFGKDPDDLTTAECAMLAGLPNAPSLYSPYVDFRLAKQRQMIVLNAMEKEGVISRSEAENARVEEIILAH